MQPLSWTTVEFEQKERHPDWIWTVGLVFGIAAVIAFFYQNIFFGILLCVSGACVIMFALRNPQQITVTLQEKALIINDLVIDTKKITAFWIDETQKPDKLLLSVQGSFVPMLVILLENVSAQTVREAFTKVCPEKEMRESFSTKIFERFGF